MNVPADTQASYSSRSSSLSVPAADLPARNGMRPLAFADARSWITFLATSGVIQSNVGFNAGAAQPADARDVTIVG